MSKPLVPRPAATITLVRDCADGIEVLRLQRNLKSGFVAGAYVFPGGGLDREDDAAELHALCTGVTEEAASQRLSLERGGLAYWIASLRECFEECGLLLAYDASGAMMALDDEAVVQRFAGYRKAMHAGTETFIGMCRKENLRLGAARVPYFSHWITPEGAPRRSDTRFFLAAAPQRKSPLHDDHEPTAHCWIRPQDALERCDRGEYPMRTPTRKTLEAFAPMRNSAELLRAMQSPRDIPP